MAKSKTVRAKSIYATREDIARRLGTLDDKDIVDVLALSPTIAEIEEAGVWLDGQGNELARRGRPQTPRINAILDIVDRDDDELTRLR